jgi:ABC-2 type transport system ATP-binding protein
MRQKINILAVLLYEPKIWILDEPMVGLDPESADLLKRKMREHAQKGNIVFMSTHVISMAETLCDKMIVIKNGKMLFYGTMDELKQNKDKDTETALLELMKRED